MFTGIVEATARVRSFAREEEGGRLALTGLPEPLALGQSLAVNGACLTVARRDGSDAGFDLAGETLRCTNLGDLRPGAVVNLERSLRFDGRVDGHLVQGHVDGVGRIQRIEPLGADWWLEVEAPGDILELCVPKGSIAVDGISLTVARLSRESFGCAIVPHTRAVTNLQHRRAGDRVNLEADLIGKWVRRLLSSSGVLPG